MSPVATVWLINVFFGQQCDTDKSSQVLYTIFFIVQYVFQISGEKFHCINPLFQMAQTFVTL